VTWTRSDPTLCARADHPLGIRLVRSELSWQGRHNRTYWYVEQPCAGVYIVAVDHNGDVALLEHYRAPFGEYFWEVPAGGVRPAEDLFECARRELLEEIGASVEEFQVLTAFAPSPGLTTTCATVLLGRGTRVVAARKETPEIRTVQFFSPAEAIDRVMQAPVSAGGSLLALLLARQALG